jgi:hypothetical protein
MRHMLPALLLAAGLLQGCASGSKSLYQWEGYQPQVYAYLKGEGSVEQQIAELEKGLQVIRARGNTPPPGYHAHLGMLSWARMIRSCSSSVPRKHCFPRRNLTWTSC